MKHLLLVVFCVGCTVGDGNRIGSSAAVCENAGSGYASCVADVTAERDRCYDGCANDTLNCALEAAIGFAAGNIDCIGPLLSQQIGCKLCDGKTGNEYLGCRVQCVVNAFDTFVRDPSFYANLQKCLVDGPPVDAFAKNFKLGFWNAVASGAGCALGYFVCTSQDSIGNIGLGSCDTAFSGGIDGCDTAHCNVAKCTCFDANDCPTIGDGATASHITGTVDCDTISAGQARLEDDRAVTCVSYRNNADTATCVNTGYNSNGDFLGGARYSPCTADMECGDQMFCEDYDCDGQRHCDYPSLGGPNNCCERYADCQAGYVCQDPDDDGVKHCKSDGTGSGG